VNIEEIDIKDVEFGEPIEEKEPNYRDGYIRGIYRAKNIIDSKQKEIERLNKIIEQNKYTADELNEIERLNNIINELEDSIVGKINVLYQVRGQSNAIQELSILLKQLRKLKGEDKE